MQTVIDKKRWAEIKKLKLKAGMGEKIGEQVCVMQAVDYVTTGGLSDHPECACLALTRYAIRVNDRADDKQRQLLKPLIKNLIGTRDGKTKERAEFLVWHSITQVMPILVAATGMKDDAKKLKSFKCGQWNEMKTFCNDLKPRLREAMKARLAGKGKNAAAAAAYAAAYAADAAAYAAADAAYAAAYAAAAAAYAAAYAYAAADAYAYAAADAEKKYWRGVQAKIWAKAFDGLKKACSIREKKAA